MERLILISTTFPDGRIELCADQLPLVLGRSRKCDVTINDGLLSRQHAEIRLNEAGYVEIRDLDSTNLTIVNEKDVTTHPLQNGDQILLGDTLILVELVMPDDDPFERTTRDLTMLPGAGDETISG